MVVRSANEEESTSCILKKKQQRQRARKPNQKLSTVTRKDKHYACNTSCLPCEITSITNKTKKRTEMNCTIRLYQRHGVVRITVIPITQNGMSTNALNASDI